MIRKILKDLRILVFIIAFFHVLIAKGVGEGRGLMLVIYKLNYSTASKSDFLSKFQLIKDILIKNY